MPKKTFEAAINANVQLVVQVKENQPNLLREVEDSCHYFEPESHDETIEKSRNRIERRSVDVFDISNGLIESQGFKNYVARAVRVKRSTDIFEHKQNAWVNRAETAYYLTTHVYDAGKANTIIRKHWHSENRNHYVRDVSLREDSSRIRNNPGIFARMRSFVLNILRFNQIKNISAALFNNALDFEGLLQLKGILT